MLETPVNFTYSTFMCDEQVVKYGQSAGYLSTLSYTMVYYVKSKKELT